MKKNKSLQQALVIYWLLLLYVVAALIWWYITLENQNKQLYKSDVNVLLNEKKPPYNSETTQHLQQLQIQKERRTTKHVAEGITFLLIIGVGAFFLYKLVKKQWSLTKQQQNFLMAVTHELKTPIAITKLNIETIQKRDLDTIVQEKLLKNSLVEINRLNELVSNILVVSQLESNEFQMSTDIIHLSNLVTEMADNLKNQTISQKIDISISPDIYITGDLLMIKLSINNLINNAIKYSPANSIVSISLHKKNNKVLFEVKDEGIGIKPDEKHKLFQKFYRSDNELTRTKKGTGLGLYLCKKIINYNRGTVTHSDNKPAGSIFTITLPTNGPL